ncbi:MAG: Ig-like domain-containing protein [Ruminococcus sp.]|nr:Ig-like domain-containing protein [Ruminococcus sp.]
MKGILKKSVSLLTAIVCFIIGGSFDYSVYSSSYYEEGNEIIGVESVELTLDELKSMDYKVDVNVYVIPEVNFENCGQIYVGFGIKHDKQLTLYACNGSSGSGYNKDAGFFWAGRILSGRMVGKHWVTSEFMQKKSLCICTLTFEIPSNAKEGDIYTIIPARQDSRGVPPTVNYISSSFDSLPTPGDKYISNFIDGYIKIVENKTATTSTTTSKPITVTTTNTTNLTTAMTTEPITTTTAKLETTETSTELITTTITNSETTTESVTTTATKPVTTTTTKLETTEITTKPITTTTTTNELQIDKTSITLKNGEQYQIFANQNNLTYRSNNTDVAIVSKKGIVTALGEGTATISIINSDSDVVQLKVKVISANGISGDLNQDNAITISDAVVFQKYILGTQTLTQEQAKCADLTKDGIINIFDLSVLKYKLFS